jgi:hypothetical protein
LETHGQEKILKDIKEKCIPEEVSQEKSDEVSINKIANADISDFQVSYFYK